MISKKKGFFFLIDSIFAIIILVMGFILLSSYNFDKSLNLQTKSISKDFFNLLSGTKINEICSDICECSLVEIEKNCRADNIKNLEYNLLEYIGELYDKNQEENITNLISEIIHVKKTFNTNIYGIQFLIDGRKVYNISDEEEMEKSKNLISIKKIIYGYWEIPEVGNYGFWGPYIVEVRAWKR